MIRHDLQLWEYAAKELELGDHRFIEAHLEDCPECLEQLASVQVAKEAIDLARGAKPNVGWARIDQRIGAMVEKRLSSQTRRPLFIRLGVVGLGLAAATAAVLTLTLPGKVPAVVPATEQPAPSSSWARVERAQGLTRVDGASSELVDGTELQGGDVLRTSTLGKAFLHLPDGSHLRVAGSSQLALTRSEADDVALTLERGSVAVRASHQRRKGFVVHTGGLSVNVVGTVFGVSNDSEKVEVSVSEGRVRVELPSGESVFVEPGQKLRFDSKTQKTKRLELTAANERELSEITAVGDATSTVEKSAVVAAVGGTPSVPPMLTAHGTPRSLPRLSAAEARSRQVSAPAPVVMAPEEPRKFEPGKTELIVEGPEAVWPTLGGGDIVRGVPAPREPVSQPAEAAPVQAPPVSQPTEWAEAPKPTEAEWAPMPAVTPSKMEGARLTEEPAQPRVVAKDLEMIFMQRAEESIEKGTCERFLLGLEDIAQDAEHTARTEQARVLRARCFDSQMRPRQAMNEYRKYLESYPRGAFAAEAHQALGE